MLILWTRRGRRRIGTGVHRVREVDRVPASRPLQLVNSTQTIRPRRAPHYCRTNAHTTGSRPPRGRHGPRGRRHAHRTPAGRRRLRRRIPRRQRRQRRRIPAHQVTLTRRRTTGRLIATESTVAHGAGAAGTAEGMRLTGAEVGLGGDGCPALDAFRLDIFDGLRGWCETS